MKRSQLLAVGALVVLAVAGSAVAFTSSPERHLAVGEPAPPLRVRDQRGEELALVAYLGSPVVVYFYPKDATPGCTKQACAFRDTWSRFEEAGVKVVGVSGGSVEDKRAFAKEHALPFPVLADEDHALARGFGVRVVLGVPSRTTFLLGRDGRVAKVYPDVDPALGVEEVLEDARKL